MKGVYAAFWAESLKVRKSKIFWITLMAFSLIAVMMGLMVLISKYPQLAGQSTIVSAKASMFKDDWPSYFELLIQTSLSLGVIGFGFVSSWVFGREYSDRVVQDLLALPVRRSIIVLSKFITIIVWSSLLALTLFASGLLTGLAVNITGWSVEIAYHFFIIFIRASFLTMLLCTPVAFIASIGRGYLLPIGFVISILAITNIIAIGLPGIVPYFPWAIPALCSGIVMASQHPGLISYVILSLTCILGLIGTVAWWRFADQS